MGALCDVWTYYLDPAQTLNVSEDLRVLKLLHQHAFSHKFVFNANGAEGMPNCRDIDRDNRLAELFFERREEIDGA